MQPEKKRIGWIDFAKGMTIFLVVVGHICSGMIKSGRFSEDETWLVYFYDFLGSIRMPLFFMVSGFLYYTKVNSNLTALSNSILKKIIALGIPYFVFSIVIWSIKYLMGSNVRQQVDINDLIMIPIVPFEHFWFLYVLLIMFVFTEVLDYCFKNNYIVLCIILAITIITWQYPPEVYLIKKTTQMIGFFYIGKMLRQNIDILRNNAFVILCGLTYIVVQSLIIFLDLDYHGIAFVASVAGAFMLLSIAMRLNEDTSVFRYFSTIGRITMAVYILHPSIGSMVRMALLKAGIGNVAVHMIVGVIVAWFLSILIYRIAARSKYLDFLFYPMKYIRIGK